MNRVFIRVALRLLAMIDVCWLWVRAKKTPQVQPVVAGAGIQSLEKLGVIVSGPVAWPEFPGLAHSFWRAQELTLFREHRQYFAEPILDLGCGDSLFGQMAGFPKNGIGVDYDASSLVAARELGSTLKLIEGDAGHLTLESACVTTCLSNSVLEHLPNLDKCFSEVWRVLKPDGCFVFSMTLGTFTSQLSYWTGQRDANYWVQTFGHLQQPSEGEVLEKLRKHGFSIETCIPYQIARTTAMYRLMVSPCFQFIERHAGDALRRRLRGWLNPKVIESLRYTRSGEGACVFVVARKSST